MDNHDKMDLFENDEDYELIQFLNYQRRVYTLHPIVEHLVKWNDHDFRVRFRLGKDVVLKVLEYIEDDISLQTDRNNAVTTINKLLLTLRFYATGNFLITAGDFMGVNKTTAYLIVQNVSAAIAKLRPRFVRMPETETEIKNLQDRFYQIAQFPRTIGAIGCTHIKIQNPGGPNREHFRNRKGYFSLKVQTVSCPDLKIMDVVARWPGLCHKQTILKKSNLYSKLISCYWKNSLIIADSDYTNSEHVVTPYLNPQNGPEVLYNKSLIKTRNPVERSHRLLKQRFPILSFGSRLKIDATQAMIVACCVLHNIACDHNDLEPPELLGMCMPGNDDLNLREEHKPEEENARQQLTEDYFAHMI